MQVGLRPRLPEAEVTMVTHSSSIRIWNSHDPVHSSCMFFIHPLQTKRNNFTWIILFFSLNEFSFSIGASPKLCLKSLMKTCHNSWSCHSFYLSIHSFSVTFILQRLMENLEPITQDSKHKTVDTLDRMSPRAQTHPPPPTHTSEMPICLWHVFGTYEKSGVHSYSYSVQCILYVNVVSEALCKISLSVQVSHRTIAEHAGKTINGHLCHITTASTYFMKVWVDARGVASNAASRSLLRERAYNCYLM